MNKQCRICNQQKLYQSFPVRRYKGKVSYRNECKDCTATYNRQYRQQNAEQISKNKKKWIENNGDRKRQLNYEWFLKNKDKARKSVKNHRLNNKPYYRFKRAQRRASQLQATLGGYNAEIKEIYKNCPTNHHVDHIIPLRGDGVCGLHVPWNLQYLTAEENLSKGNKYENYI